MQISQENSEETLVNTKRNSNGKLLLSSNKLNCACKFVQNSENSSINSNKALSTLPRFKEIERKTEKTQENTQSVAEIDNFKQNIEKKPKDSKKKLNKQGVISTSLRKPRKSTDFPANIRENANIPQLFPYNNKKISYISPSFTPENQQNLMNFPTYSQLLSFYLRKKAETPLFPDFY